MILCSRLFEWIAFSFLADILVLYILAYTFSLFILILVICQLLDSIGESMEYKQLKKNGNMK